MFSKFDSNYQLLVANIVLLKKSGVNRKLGPSERETGLNFILKLSPLQNHFATQFCQCDSEVGEGRFCMGENWSLSSRGFPV